MFHSSLYTLGLTGGKLSLEAYANCLPRYPSSGIPAYKFINYAFCRDSFFFFFFTGFVVNQCSDDTQRHQREFLECVESNVGQRLVGVSGCLQDTHNNKDDIHRKKAKRDPLSYLYQSLPLFQMGFII